MITYGQALEDVKAMLRDSGIEEYAVDSFLLLSELFGMSRTQYYMKQKEFMPDADYENYMLAAARRSRHEPLQYITGKAYFMGYEFQVDENVLIPRMDTEVLVAEAEKVLKAHFPEKEQIRILDMCTGSGCILISMLLRNERISGIGVDVSEGTLGVARQNAEHLHCDSVEFLYSDLFENVAGTFDMIVSNPPYIKTEVIKGLMEEVKSFEPFAALDGLEDGLHFYREITREAVKYLNKGGFLCYEIGYDQSEAVVSIMKENGFENCFVVKDLAGLDRVCIGNL